ncbi:MAG: arginine deiminase family protein [Polyangiaceae bacterium]
MVTKLSVRSETATLRSVVVHRPGDEIARMTQHQLDHLLFDDILSPAAAIAEHDLMSDILRGGGAEVLEIGDLLSDALGRASGRERRQLLTSICAQSGVEGLAEPLLDWPAPKLAEALVQGVSWSALEGAPMTLARLRRELSTGDDVALAPVPNLMFMRDPCFALHDRVVVGRMATAARAREPLLVSFAIHHAEAVAARRLLFEDAQRSTERIEGGDVMVLSEKVLVVGCSQRTSAATVERLAREAVFDAFSEVERVYAVFMPEQRSIMHLDTIVTQIDERMFLGHQPLVCGESALPVARIERDQPARLVEGASLLDVLDRELGGVEMVPCGGADPIHQEREQWTDGANAFCLSPGRIILYSRNVHTIEALRAKGFVQVDLSTVLPPEQRAELIAKGMAEPRVVFSFSGSELSRARGGGRCLTMPIRRA